MTLTLGELDLACRKWVVRNVETIFEHILPLHKFNRLDNSVNLISNKLHIQFRCRRDSQPAQKTTVAAAEGTYITL